ncbi:MAG: hypothetical protein KY454_10985, partial [Actinobacteria bacterium]|nr:hypothetical protein [Actinomycetota bacterium]
MKEGLTKKEAMRCLKRYVTREGFAHLPESDWLDIPSSSRSAMSHLTRRAFGGTRRGAQRESRTPHRAWRLHYFGESCPVEQIAHVCRAG